MTKQCVRILTITLTMLAGMFSDAMAQAYLVSDAGLKAILRVDPLTGSRTIVSGNETGADVGTGVALESPRDLGVEPNGRIIVLNYIDDVTIPVVIAIDEITGDRTTISGNGVGNGPAMVFPQNLEIGPDGGFYLGQDGNAIIRVDGDSGDRTIVSDATTGTGPQLASPPQLVFDTNGDILAGDGDTIYRIDPVTGNRTIITSDDGDPGGQIVGTGADIALVSDLMVEADGNIVVLDGVNQILIRVDVVTGDRTFLQQGQGTGPLITLSQSALQLPSGPIVVMNIIDKSILHFDPVTHDRTLISDNSTGIGTLFVLPIYLALEPPLNAPPLADDDAAITDEGFPITISVLDNDIDPEESALSIIGVTQGVNGTVQIEDGDQTVTYAPDPGFSGTDTFTYIVSDGAKSSTATVSVTVNFISRLRFENAYVVPGTPATVAVSLDVSVPVSEVSFDIQPQLNSTATTVVQFGSGLNHVEPLGFDLATSIGQDGLVTVTLNTSSGATIPVGETTILVLLFDSNENTPVATDLDLVITAVLLEDSNSAPILQEADSGQIRFGQPGDPTLDGVFNILDIGRVVRHILQILPPPLDFDLFLADANSDEMLDIRDAITVVNLFLFGEPVPPAKLTSGNTVRMAEVGLADARKVDEGYLLPITLNSNGSVSGMQVALTVEGPDVTIGSPMLADNAAGLFLDYNILDDVVNLVLMGQSGERFLPGSGAVILVPIVAQPSLYPNITLKDALLSDMYAMEIPVQISNRSAAIEPDPGGFQLISASPNPFNPTTSIAYAVEEESQISLIVYNLLGQEVVRLVNRAHAPGRYSVEWDGRNERGVSVGSGVYIYRLVSSAGFAASRRMTLLK